jgi:hypothetical protein
MPPWIDPVLAVVGALGGAADRLRGRPAEDRAVRAAERRLKFEAWVAARVAERRK